MYRCKICGKKYTELTALYNHIESKHKEMIPKDMTVQQYYYYMKTGKMNGNCVMCKQPTGWNENTGKYNRFCGNPKCKEEYVKIMKSRMVAKYGKTHLLNDPNKQREMLANRSISGEYTWSDGKHKSTYTGSYELDFLKTLDGFFDWDPEDISMPSPHTYTYKYEGEDKFYIPDVFIHSLDLEIEIKDGGDNPNNHHKIQDVDKEKERLKDEVLCSQKAFHYIKITNKNYENFFRFLKEIKKEFEKYEDETKIPRIFKIEDIKGTNVKPVKESVEILEETDIFDKGIEKIKKFNNVKYKDRDIFLSLKYDLVKNDPKELQRYLSSLVKAARFEDDIWYVQKMSKRANDYYKLQIKKHPEMKDVYGIYYDWLKSGGLDKGIKERRKKGVKLIENYEIVDEAYLRNKKDLYVNFELFDSGQSNVCLVTGLSGSGKSTLSDNLCRKYNAKCIELDVFEHPDMELSGGINKKFYNEYFNNKARLKYDLINNNLSNTELATEMSNALLYALNYCNSHPNERFIIEGLQIFADIDPEHVKGLPIVFVNTSMINSMIRKCKRDKYGYKVADLFEWYIADEKKFNGFKEEILEENLILSKDNMEFNIDKFGQEENILYITGLGGSGKSTIISEYARKYNAQALEFDAITSALIRGLENLNRNKIHPIILEYLETQNPNKLNGFNDDNFGVECVKFLDWFENKVSGDGNLYILEGMQIFLCFEPERFINKPMVVMGTSVAKSMYRSTYRVYKRSEGDITKTLKFFVKTMKRTKIFVKNDKQIKDLVHTIGESYIIDTMKESSISIPQMNYYLQNQYEEEMRNYLNTYKKYYNLMLKEQPSAVKHINEDIRKCLIVIDGLADKGVENNLVQFAKDDLGEIVKAAKHGKPVRVFESRIDCKIVYSNPDSKQIFSLMDRDSKLIIENSFIVQRDGVGTHCSVTPYYKEIEEENILEFQLLLDEEVNMNDLEDKISEGVIISNLYKFNDKEYRFIRESCLRLFGVYPKEIKIK